MAASHEAPSSEVVDQAGMDAEFSVLYSSPELVVVDKPPKVAMDGPVDDERPCTVESWVHTSLKDFLAEPLPEAASTRPGGGKPLIRDKSLKFVHQLDFATSGVLCLAFSKDMAAALSHCFEFRQTRKIYSALVHGWVDDDKLSLVPGAHEASGTESQKAATVACGARLLPKNVSLRAEPGTRGAAVVDTPVALDPTDEAGFRMRAVSDPDAHAAEAAACTIPALRGKDLRPQDALSVVSVVARGYLAAEGHHGNPAQRLARTEQAAEDLSNDDLAVKVTLVRLRLYTGRRHQLRLHCRALGHPIVGDRTYVPGTLFEAAAAPRMMLHALKLTVGMDVAAFQRMDAKERHHNKVMRKRETKGVIEMADNDTLPTTVFEASDVVAGHFVPCAA